MNLLSFHTPETEHKTITAVAHEGNPRPCKSKISSYPLQADDFVVFFYNKGIIYTMFPAGPQSLLIIYEGLSRFLVHFRKKRLEMAASESYFHWDTAPVHTATVVQTFVAQHNIQVILLVYLTSHLQTFYLFPKVIGELVGRTLTQETFKLTWEGVLRKVAKFEFAAAFESWYRRCFKCRDQWGQCRKV
jgi:hypothetical protein